MAVDQLLGLRRRLAYFSDKIMRPNKYLERNRDSMRSDFALMGFEDVVHGQVHELGGNHYHQEPEHPLPRLQ
jgi:hypothetical protein